MSEQQNHCHEEAAQNQALAGLVRFLARRAVEDYQIETLHHQPQEIHEFVPRTDKCACSASAITPAFGKGVK